MDDNYLDYKNKLEQICNEKANGVKIRSKCEWYEFEEKAKNQVRTLLCGEKEVTDKHKINQELEYFYKKLFTEKL